MWEVSGQSIRGAQPSRCRSLAQRHTRPANRHERDGGWRRPTAGADFPAVRAQRDGWPRHRHARLDIKRVRTRTIARVAFGSCDGAILDGSKRACGRGQLVAAFRATRRCPARGRDDPERQTGRVRERGVVWPVGSTPIVGRAFRREAPRRAVPCIGLVGAGGQPRLPRCFTCGLALAFFGVYAFDQSQGHVVALEVFVGEDVDRSAHRR